MANRVDVSAGKGKDVVVLDPGAERILTTPPPGPTRATVLRPRAAHSERPADLDPTSGDHRELAVWVHFER